MTRTMGVMLVAAVAALVMTATGGLPAEASAKAGAQTLPPGETILLQSCQGCHDLRVIQTSAMNAEEWTKTIEEMRKMGAEVPDADRPVLVRYLALNFGPVPDGPGKEILLNTCTMCHDLGRIKSARRSAEEWEETLNSMLNEGAPVSDDQFPVIHGYLSRHFNVE